MLMIKRNTKTNKLVPWSAMLLEKLVFLSWLRNSMHFIEPECSLLHSHGPTTCPYSESHESSPCCPHSTSLRSIFMLSHPPISPESSLSFGFPHQNPVCISRFPHEYQTPTILILLALIALIIIGEQYKW